MSSGPVSITTQCSACGAVLASTAAECGYCRARHELEQNPVQRSAAESQFSLGTLMLLVALVAICLGLIRAMPPLGAAVTIFSLPALSRTVAWTTLRRWEGRPPSLGDKVMAFWSSFALIVAFFAAAVLCVLFFGWLLSMVHDAWREASAPRHKIPLDFIYFIALVFDAIGGLVLFTYVLFRSWPGANLRESRRQ